MMFRCVIVRLGVMGVFETWLLPLGFLRYVLLCERNVDLG